MSIGSFWENIFLARVKVLHTFRIILEEQWLMSFLPTYRPEPQSGHLVSEFSVLTGMNIPGSWSLSGFAAQVLSGYH